MRSRPRSFLFWTFVATFAVFVASIAPSFVGVASAEDRAPVMKAFEVEAPQPSALDLEAAQKEKHKILFLMGAALLFLVITTAALGVAMALFGKEVFVAHMLTAGATVFLAIAHAVTAMVWFYPF